LTSTFTSPDGNVTERLPAGARLRLKAGGGSPDPVGMAWASQLGPLVFLVVSTIAGGRLLFRGLRTRGHLELLLGITYFFGGPLGYVPLVLVVSGATPEDWTRELRMLGHLNLELSAAALYVFDWRVFRPGSRACAALALAAVAGLGATWLGLVFVDGLEGRSLSGSNAYWCDFWLRAGAYAWAAGESLHHHARGRRRLALGLADPVVVDRFRLWGIAMAAISGMFGNAFIVALLNAGHAPPPLWYLLDGFLALVASATMWVTFFPPRRYLARFAAVASVP
jgi:hypothetical protein